MREGEGGVVRFELMAWLIGDEGRRRWARMRRREDKVARHLQTEGHGIGNMTLVDVWSSLREGRRCLGTIDGTGPRLCNADHVLRQMRYIQGSEISG